MHYQIFIFVQQRTVATSAVTEDTMPATVVAKAASASEYHFIVNVHKQIQNNIEHVFLLLN